MIHARGDYQERFSEDPEGHIKADEPVILFRAQDKHFIQVLAHYRGLIVSDNEMEHEQKLTIAKLLDEHINLAQDWQANMDNVVKTPDVPPLGTNESHLSAPPKKQPVETTIEVSGPAIKPTADTHPIPALK